MTCAYDAEESGVEPRSADPRTTVRLWNRVTPYDDGDFVDVCVELLADYVRATLHGWPGVRSWEAPDHDLRIDAGYITSDYVGLMWTITPWRGVAGRWSVSVKSTIQAGEDLRQFAVRVNRFLPPDNE